MSESPTPAPPNISPPSNEPAKTSGLAIASLVLGILGILTACLGIGLVLGILALVLGIIAATQAGDPDRRVTGKGMAISGAVLGGAAVVLVLLVVPIAILMPALGAARRTARQMQNNTQVRSVHQSMITYAQSNRGWYPGLDDRGKPDGIDVELRLAVLLEGNYFAGVTAISPVETKTVWTTGPVTTSHYSYAMLQVPEDGGRRAEWKDTINTQAVAMSDRNVGPGTGPTQVQSIHTDTPGDWKGSVSWNDNHVDFVQSDTLVTKYGAGPFNNSDALFESESTFDAEMIHSGN